MATLTSRPIASAVTRAGGAAPPAAPRRAPRAARYAAALSAYAGLGHLIVTPQHLREWWAYGAFFVVAALGQAIFAAVVLRWPRPRVALLGIATNLAIVGMYVLSRTAGVPAGPHAGRAESAGVLDMTTTAVELALVVTLVALLRGATARCTINALLALGSLLWAARLAGLL